MSPRDAGLARFPRSRLPSKSFVKFVSQKPKLIQKALRACLHGGGGAQVGEVTCLGGVTRLSI